MILYKEWLSLDKKLFRILVMLADLGQFSGTYSDICRYFLVSPQSKNRKQFAESIAELSELGLIEFHTSGRTIFLSLVPKEEEIEVDGDQVEKIRLRSPSDQSVSWEAVLKVYLWCLTNKYDDLITNEMIVKDTSLSPSVICAAKNVLDQELGAIVRETVSDKIDDDTFRVQGQHIGATAFWK